MFRPKNASFLSVRVVCGTARFLGQPSCFQYRNYFVLCNVVFVFLEGGGHLWLQKEKDFIPQAGPGLVLKNFLLHSSFCSFSFYTSCCLSCCPGNALKVNFLFPMAPVRNVSEQVAVSPPPPCLFHDHFQKFQTELSLWNARERRLRMFVM